RHDNRAVDEPEGRSPHPGGDPEAASPRRDVFAHAHERAHGIVGHLVAVYGLYQQERIDVAEVGGYVELAIIAEAAAEGDDKGEGRPAQRNTHRSEHEKRGVTALCVAGT